MAKRDALQFGTRSEMIRTFAHIFTFLHQSSRSFNCWITEDFSFQRVCSQCIVKVFIPRGGSDSSASGANHPMSFGGVGGGAGGGSSSSGLGGGVGLISSASSLVPAAFTSHSNSVNLCKLCAHQREVSFGCVSFDIRSRGYVLRFSYGKSHPLFFARLIM